MFKVELLKFTYIYVFFKPKYRDLTTQLDYYYDLFEQNVYVGALFIGYVPFKNEKVFDLYFSGNNRSGYFPLQVYLTYFDMYVQRVNDRSMPAYQYLDEPTKVSLHLFYTNTI